MDQAHPYCSSFSKTRIGRLSACDFAHSMISVLPGIADDPDTWAKFSLFPRKTTTFLSDDQKAQIVEAIRQAESRTSGEIRVFMESHCKYVDPIERASEVFFSLKMDQTQDRNAVLLYIAIKDHQLAIYGDSGIYERTGNTYWEDLVAHIVSHFDSQNFAGGISNYISEIGEGLHHYFPYDRVEDQNELPDDIVFGH